MTRSFKVKVRLWKYHIPVLPSHTRLHDKLVLQICVWKVSLFRFSQATDFQEPSGFNKDHSSENPPQTSSAHWLQLHTGTVASGNTWKQRLQQSVTILLALICGSSWPRHSGDKTAAVRGRRSGSHSPSCHITWDTGAGGCQAAPQIRPQNALHYRATEHQAWLYATIQWPTGVVYSRLLIGISSHHFTVLSFSKNEMKPL